MRRLLLLVLLVVGLTIPAACGGGDDLAAFAFPTVSSGEPGVDPKVISSTAPPTETVIQVLHEGTGQPIAAHDVLVADAKAQVWSTGGVELPSFLNTFSGGRLLFRAIDQTVPGWGKVLPGIKVGSRVLMVTPPVDGFGPEGNPQVGIGKDDTLIWVVDIVDAVPVDAVATGTPGKALPNAAALPTVTAGKNPTITVPKAAAPKKLVAEPLLVGQGAKVAKGQTILAQYTGTIWRDGSVFDTSWKPDRGPFNARIAETDQKTGEPGVIKGWVDGLAGQRVGSRILLVVPPNLGYQKAGNPQAGITGTDTLVFVVDILGAYGDPAAPS
ncbi:MAG TPA: FKBP-type peptidyl-prolyl cis-trans isomerase [Sporichthya sp.]|nr:FKBP-type peptidyl-prolyl cis-trans isomerase [Sporichthya sp.]